MKYVPIHITDKFSTKTSYEKGSLVFIWDEFLEDDNAISLPSLVEEKADIYRAAFLSWTHDFSQTKINETTLYEYLKLEDDFPFWWTSSLGQRFNINASSSINDVIKSMAFFDYLAQEKLCPTSINITTERDNLSDFFKLWGKSQKIEVNSKHIIRSKKVKKPVLAYALYLFRFIVYGLFDASKKQPQQNEFVFFDIFTHLKNGAEFKSNYWTKLVEILQKNNVQWNHLYYKTKHRFSYLNALKRIQLFNASSEAHQHQLLEQNFDLLDYFKTLNRYFKIRKKAKQILPQLSKAILCPNRGIDFSPYLIDDLMDSLVGQEALKNCFYSVLMENAVKATPLDAKGIYLQEFQPWEIALVHYWKKTQRNDLIAMPHSTHRYWDLRYFFAEKFFLQYAQDIFPNQIAVNGDYSFERCIENGYPEAILKRVEALRYNDHHKTPLRRKNIDKKVLNLLICCDYQTKTSEKLFEMVDKAINAGKLKCNVTVRMHPAFPLPPELLAQYNFEISKEEMVTALQETDWVITSNLSAIAVDGYYQGCNIAQLSDGLYFNLSPLRGVVDDLLFNSAEELKQMIFKQKQVKKSIPYFLIDSKTKKWENLLSL
ncbi:hypothetical protein N9Y86_01560 [Flavobacteriaceae bacterium]|nr:hypothetical protein [Flavobacteriaceae bacterium]